MGDMPCVWCLLFITSRPYGPVVAHTPADESQSYSVSHWAHAESLVHESGYVLRDHNNDRCGLTAATLVSGDAVCHGHAVGVLRARLR